MTTPKEIKAMLAQMTGGRVLELGIDNDRPQKQSWPVTILPDAQIRTLKEQLDDYVNPQFKVGDIVTVKPISTTRGVGQPSMVVEVRYDAKVEGFKDDRAGTAADGRVLNIRVMTFVDDEMITCFWDEAWNYELWEDRKHGK